MSITSTMGKRCQRTFALGKKKAAEAWYTTTKVEIRNGVHTPDSASITDQKIRKEKPQSKLTRVAFRVSRLMEFCTKRELQNQTGARIL